MTEPYLFILFDNQDITRLGLISLINKYFNGARYSLVPDKVSLVEALELNKNAIVILDYTLSDLRSYDELMILVHRFTDSSWIHFSNEMSNQLIRKLTCEDRFSIILKDCDEHEIIDAIISAADQQAFLCHEVKQFVNSQVKKDETIQLTPSEIDILKMIAKGMSVKEIALARYSSIHTITTHKKNIFRKLDVNTVYEATKYALRAGLVEMTEYYI